MKTEIMMILFSTILSFVSAVFVFKTQRKIERKEKEKESKLKEEKESKEKCEKDAENLNTLCLSMSRMMLLGWIDKEVERGYTTTSTYDCLEALYKTYIMMGGNGVVHLKWENEFSKLPIKDY